MTGRTVNDETNAGFALVAVLWLLVGITVLLAPIALAARHKVSLARNASDQFRLALAAEAIGFVAVEDLGNKATAFGRENERRAVDEYHWCSAAEVLVGIRVRDQRGLIDLNVAPEALLTGGLEALGLATAEAEDAARRTIAYRSAGAMSPFDEAGMALKSAPFESVSELVDLLASAQLTDAVLRSVFTVHSKRTQIDPQYTPAVLDGVSALHKGPIEAEGRTVEIGVAVADRRWRGVGQGSFVVRLSARADHTILEIPPVAAVSRPDLVEGLCPESVEAALRGGDAEFAL